MDEYQDDIILPGTGLDHAMEIHDMNDMATQPIVDQQQEDDSIRLDSYYVDDIYCCGNQSITEKGSG